MKTLLTIAGAIALLTPASSAGEKNIVETAVAAGSFQTLAQALTTAELVDALQGDGPFTVFAPTDEAFAKLPDGTVAELLRPENRDRLTAILTYHVVAGEVTSKQVVEIDAAPTLNGQRLAVDVADSGVRIAEANVTAVDIACSNGVIHVIDQVLLPTDANIVETATRAGQFGTLIAAVKAAGLADTLMGEGPFTVLAPTDDAFAKLPEGTIATLLKPENRDQLVDILTFHVLPGRVYSDQALDERVFSTVQSSPVTFALDGRSATVEGAQLVGTDVEASNGVIHVIDSVIMPPIPSAHATSGSSSSCSSTSAGSW